MQSQVTVSGNPASTILQDSVTQGIIHLPSISTPEYEEGYALQLIVLSQPGPHHAHPSDRNAA